MEKRFLLDFAASTPGEWKVDRARRFYLDCGFLKKMNVLLAGYPGWSLGREIPSS